MEESGCLPDAALKVAGRASPAAYDVESERLRLTPRRADGIASAPAHVLRLMLRDNIIDVGHRQERNFTSCKISRP